MITKSGNIFFILFQIYYPQCDTCPPNFNLSVYCTADSVSGSITFASMRKLKTSEMGRLSPEAFREAPKQDVVVVLDNVRSMHNVGSVFRTGDAFRIAGIHLCGITAVPPHREIRKTAIGAENTVDWKYFKETSDAVFSLKAEGYRVYGIEQTDNSVSLQDIKFPGGKIAFVFGNEIDGVKSEVLEICDACIEIPQIGTKHSLNISVSCGIVLWEYSRLRLPDLPASHP